MLSVSLQRRWLASTAVLNPYSFSAAALAASTCAGSVTTFDGSVVTHPSNASGSSAFGEGGKTIVVADCFSAAVGCWPCATATTAPPLSATQPATIAIHLINRLLHPSAYTLTRQPRRARAPPLIFDTEGCRKVPNCISLPSCRT